eukprot:5445686-Pleurochrysis_carterae.AAC.3
MPASVKANDCMRESKWEKRLLKRSTRARKEADLSGLPPSPSLERSTNQSRSLTRSFTHSLVLSLSRAWARVVGCARALACSSGKSSSQSARNLWSV